MRKATHPEQQFGDAVYRFELTPDQIFEIETGMPMNGGLVAGGVPRFFGLKPMPIFELFSNIISGRVEAEGGSLGNPFRSGASMANICNVVRLALIGGGCDPAKARELVEENAPPNRPLQELWDLASAILYVSLVGMDEANG